MLLFASIFHKLAREFSQPIRIAMSNRPIDENFKVFQGKGHKLKGLWYAFGGAWLSWMSGEMPEWIGNYDYIYVIDVDESKLVKVTNETLTEFTDKYKDPTDFYGKIDWRTVSQDYCGFEAPPPYVKSWDSPFWWETLDVPSGCIWDSSCITNVRRIGEKKSDEWHLSGEEGERVVTDLPSEIEEKDFYKNIWGWGRLNVDIEECMSKLAELVKFRVSGVRKFVVDGKPEDVCVFEPEEINYALQLSLSAFNMFPHVTYIKFTDEENIEQISDLLVTYAAYLLLSKQSLLEMGRQFSINSGGVSYEPPDLGKFLNNVSESLYRSWFEKINITKSDSGFYHDFVRDPDDS